MSMGGGERFGRWVVGQTIDKRFVNCICDCGTERKVN